MFALLLSVACAFQPFYEEVNCADFNKNCRECVRYTQDFKDFRRGCEWCSMPNYFDSYCFNPNTTVCAGTVQDVCQLDPVIISVLCVLCVLPLLIIMAVLVVPTIIKKLKPKKD